MDDLDAANEAEVPVTWDVRREGRAWNADEFSARAARLVELKMEIAGGKLFWSDETRMLVRAMLLENVGLDAAVGLGDLAQWKEALAHREGRRSF